MKKKDIELRKKFLTENLELDKWLKTLGFTSKYDLKFYPEDNHCSFYEQFIDSMAGVEKFTNDILNLCVRIERDRNEHKLIVINRFGECSQAMTFDEFKVEISTWIKQNKNKIQLALDSIAV